MLKISYDSNVEGTCTVELLKILSDIAVCEDTPTGISERYNVILFNDSTERVPRLRKPGVLSPLWIRDADHPARLPRRNLSHDRLRTAPTSNTTRNDMKHPRHIMKAIDLLQHHKVKKPLPRCLSLSTTSLATCIYVGFWGVSLFSSLSSSHGCKQARGNSRIQRRHRTGRAGRRRTGGQN